MTNTSLFDTYKYCENCRKPLPISYKDALCPNCKESALFHEVKEYIRENIVNEYQVAEHFHIPRRQVREWIREGRIEYVEHGPGSIKSTHCQKCGMPIDFGTLCPKCAKVLHTHAYHATQETSDTKMHYLDIPNHKKKS